MLSAAYGSAWEQFEGRADEALTFDGLDGRLAERDDLLAVSSHRLIPGHAAGLSVYPIALVRDPLDRAYSCYSYQRRAPSNCESDEVAKRTDFAGYVQWCLDHPRRGGMVMIDYQTIHLSSAALKGPILDVVATDRDYERAARFLTALPVVGIVDRFDNFCERLQPSLERWWGEPLNLGPPRRCNISPERTETSISEARARLKAMLGWALSERFAHANRRDQALYAFAADLAASQNRAFFSCEPSHTRQEHRLAASAGR